MSSWLAPDTNDLRLGARFGAPQFDCTQGKTFAHSLWITSVSVIIRAIGG